MLRSVALFVTVLIVPATSSAQTQIGVGLGYSIPSGLTYSDSEAGTTLGGHLAVGVSANIVIGIGLDLTFFSVEYTERREVQGDAIAMARYLFPSGAARFFLGGKLGYSVNPGTVCENLAESPCTAFIPNQVSSGFLVGPTVGVQIPALQIRAGSIFIELTADGLFHSNGNVESEGRTIPDTSRSGLRVVPRVAIAIPIAWPLPYPPRG